MTDQAGNGHRPDHTGLENMFKDLNLILSPQGAIEEFLAFGRGMLRFAF